MVAKKGQPGEALSILIVFNWVICILQAKEQSASLQDTLKRIDVEMSRTAKFLQEMMPKQIADRIKKGEPTLPMTQVS